MPIRAVKQRSERGKIKDLTGEPEVSPTPFELRAKKLFEYAQKHQNKELMAQTGFITTDYIADKNALPLSVYRIRRIVDDIKSKSPGSIERLSQEFLDCIAPIESTLESDAYWKNKTILKIASVRKPAFWRVSRK